MKYNSKNKLLKSLTLLFLSICFLILTNCTKENTNIIASDSGTNLAFTINGINEDNSLIDLTKSASVSKNNLLNTPIADTKLISKEILSLENGLDAILTIEESNYSDAITAPQNERTKIISKLQASTTKMTSGNKYRVILYEAGTNNIKADAIGTSGTQLKIPVEKGKSYDWSVVSYNSTENPPSGNTVITDHKDLLHAASTTPVTIPNTQGNITVDIPIILNHILGQVIVEVNTSLIPGNITSISAQFGANNYFQNGTMNIKNGSISNKQIKPTGPVISFAGTPQQKTAEFYTTDFSKITPFTITLNSLNVNVGSITKSLGTARTYSFGNITPAAGKSIKAKIEFLSVAEFSCIQTTAYGNYIVDKPLDASNYIEATINVTKVGDLNLETIDKNGMKFSSGIVSVNNLGPNTIRLNPVNSRTVLVSTAGVNVLEGTDTPSKPNDAEETTSTAVQNLVNNQIGTYNIISTINNDKLCDVNIDVKPQFFDGEYMNTSTASAGLVYTSNSGNYWWPANNAIYATDGIYKSINYSPKDGRIQIDLANAMSFNSAYQSVAPQYRCLWFTFAKNVSGQTITTHKGAAKGTADWVAGYTTKSDWTYNTGAPIANNNRIGSLDPYNKTSGSQPNVGTTLVDGAHGAGSNMQLLPVWYAEATNAGLVIKIGNYYYKYRLLWSTKRGSNNNPYLVSTFQSLALYGITKVEPSSYYIPRNTAASESGTAQPGTYTGTDDQIGDRNIRSYNP